MTTVRATRFCDCPFSAVVEFSEEALRTRPDVTLSIAPATGARVHVESQLTDDVSDISRKHDALLLSWKPPVAQLFPDFHGVLTVRPAGRGSQMRIQGSYEPPFGLAGRVFDTLAGQFIARLTLRRLLRDIAGVVEHRWKVFRKELPV